MKKALLLFVLVAMSAVSINAQNNLKWGLMAGMNVSKYTFTGFDNRVGFHAGVKAELGLSQGASGAYLDFAGLLSLKGAKIDGGAIASITFNPVYLEVPVHIGYKYAVNDDLSLFGSVGPYIGIGLFGKAKMKVGSDVAGSMGLDDNSMSENIFGEDGMNRFDAGLGLKAGLEFSHKYQVSLSYDFGLVDVVDELGMKNRNLMISFGYMF